MVMGSDGYVMRITRIRFGAEITFNLLSAAACRGSSC
jgi:hypothetical protein